MSERLFLSSDVSRALAGLSRTWLTAMRTCTLYPATHPVTVGAVSRFAAALGATTKCVPGFAVAVTPTTLLVSGSEVCDELAASDRAAVRDIAGLLHARGVLELAFDARVPHDALVRLLGLLGGVDSPSEPREDVATAWQRIGHPAVRIRAVDYGRLLEDREASPAASRDDLWRSIISALRSGRRALDEREQQRLLDLAADPAELATLAETLTAEQCTPDGSPLLSTQAATVLSCFRQLASIASVLEPDRLPHVVRNLVDALVQLDPRVAMEVLSSDRERPAEAAGTPYLGDGLDESAMASLLAKVVIADSGASPRVAELFQLLVPDGRARHRVVDRARSIAADDRRADGRPFDEFWESVGELLGAYKEQQFASEQYRAVLDASPCSTNAAAPAVAEMGDWIDGLGEGPMRSGAIDLLADLARMEPATDRAVIVLNHLAQLAEELLMAGAFGEATRAIEAIGRATSRDDLATAAAQVLDRLAAGGVVTELTPAIGDFGDDDWPALRRCYLALGPASLAAFAPVAALDRDSTATQRAGEVFAAMGAAAVDALAALLGRLGPTARIRAIGWLGRIASPRAVPALQSLLRTADAPLLEAAVSALAGIADPAAARAIHLVLQTSSDDNRQAIVGALVSARDRRVVPMLVRILQECHPLNGHLSVTVDVLDALGRLQDPRAVTAIARVMALRTWWHRRQLRALKQACVSALDAIADPTAQAALHEAERRGDRLLRRIVIAERSIQRGVA